MREIGTPKIGSHITNLHIKRPRITINLRIGSRKRPFLDCIYAKYQIKRPHITRAACTEKLHVDETWKFFESSTKIWLLKIWLGTVNPVYNNNPRDPIFVAVIDSWLLCRSMMFML